MIISYEIKFCKGCLRLCVSSCTYGVAISRIEKPALLNSFLWFECSLFGVWNLIKNSLLKQFSLTFKLLAYEYDLLIFIEDQFRVELEKWGAFEWRNRL